MVLALFVYPLCYSLVSAFFGRDGQFGFGNFAKTFELYGTDIVFTTVIVAVSTLVIAVLAAAIGGYLVLGAHPAAAAVLKWLYRWPLFVPFIVAAQCMRSFLAKNGIDPAQQVEWRQYPANLLALAVDKGEVQALAEIDPLPYLWLKDGKLNEIATNLSGEFVDRTCCVLAIRGSLIRSELPVAAALTRSILEAAELVANDAADAAAIYSGYGGKGSVEDLATMYRGHTHHNHPVGAPLKKQLLLYTDELRAVNVMKKSTDSAKFAERIYTDVLG